MSVSSDDSTPIRKIVASLQDHLVEGTLLAAFVVWFFLRNFRSTLIIATAIPVSLLGAIAAMFFLGLTFNQMSLLGLLLLIGVVVDDAIVVLENIYRRHEHSPGIDRYTAAIEGTQQVGFAVIAASLTLVSIFGSVLFLEGIVARFFQSFAVVVTVGVLVSLFVSLTLTPMLCSRFLDVRPKRGPIYRQLGRLLDGLDHGYRRLLGWVLENRGKVLLATLLLVLSSGFFFARVDKDFIPVEDDARFMVSFRAPLGTSRATMEELVEELDGVIRAHPEVQSAFIGIGFGGTSQVNSGMAFVTMVPRSERRISQQQFIEKIQAEFAGIPGVLAFASSPSPIGGMRGDLLQFSIVGPDLDAVASLSNEMYRQLSEVPGFGRVDLDLQLDLPQIRLDVDRVRAADIGLTTADIAYSVNMLAGGVDIAKYSDDPGDGDRYDIRVKAAEGTITSADDLRRIFLRTRDGQMVRLDTVAHAVDIVGPAVINRYALQYSANFYTNPSMSLGDAVTLVRERAAEILPPGYSMELQGRSREFAKTSGYVKIALSLAAGARLHGARKPVQFVPAAAHRDDGAAARHRRRPVRALDHRHVAEHDLDDRPGAADGARREELDPAGGPDQPAARAGQADGRRAARGVSDPDATGADDVADGDPGSRARGARPRGRCRRERTDGDRGDRRHGQLDAAHARRRAGRVLSRGAGPAAPAGQARSTQGLGRLNYNPPMTRRAP